MEEAIVSFAIKRISNLLIHEAVFLSGVRDEVERLQAELKRMQCFLEDADREQQQDKRLRNRVAEIRDLAYDAEDVIDSFILKVAHQGGFQGIMKRFTSIFTKPFHLHKTGEQIKAIQTKLEDISKSLPAYEIPGEGEGSSSTSRIQQQQLRRTYPHDIEEEDVVGLEGITKNVLAQLMTEEEDRRHVVVSIVGMGGIGKTTLAKKVYNHNDVKQHFDCFAWAFISQQCMPREVLHDVLIKVLSPSNGEREKIDRMRKDELVEKLFHALGEKRYLVVFDDIWKREDWDLFKPAFPRGKKGSKILFTTRNREVALHADPFNSPIELQPLTDDESWRLICKKAFPRHTMETDARSREFESLGREMVKRCGGLPLAVVALGGLLATKSSRSQWEMVHRNIQQEDGAVKGILALSYNDLPYYLKPCFLSLGYYPEDWEISKEELIRIWIAEGFISESMESEEMLMEDVAERFLEELVDRCLVQVGKRDFTGVGVKTCRIHDLLRDLCVDKAQEQNFLKIIQPSLLVETSGDSLDVTLSKSMPRRLAIHPSQMYVCLKGKHPNLRSLLLFQNESLSNLHISEYKRFKLLSVLYLVKRDVHKWHVSSEIGKLLHLRYLRLQCDSKEIILPRTIGKLKSLKTLLVQIERGLISVPNVLFKLKYLRHILLFDDWQKDFSDGANIRLSVRDVSKCIETLKFVGSKNLVENDVMASLTNIRSLGVIFETSKDVKPILETLIRSNHLRSLNMKLFEESYPNLEPLSQCHHLGKLFLKGRIEEDGHSKHHILHFLPANIVKLGTKLVCSTNGFPQLDSLEMRDLAALEEWKIEEGAMPRLRSLVLQGVSGLRMLPEGLTYLTALQEMKLVPTRGSLVERIQVINGRQGEDFSNVSHIPSIQNANTILSETRGIGEREIIITYGGNWDGNVYRGGFSELLFVSSNITYEALLGEVHGLVGADLSDCSYELRTMLNTKGMITRFKIRRDRDIQYVFGASSEVPQLFVTVEHGQHLQNQSFRAPPLAKRIEEIDGREEDDFLKSHKSIM